MRLDLFLIGLVLFSAVMVSAVLMITNVSSNYDVTVDTSDFDDSYNISGSMYDLSQDMKNKSLEAETEGADESWESLVKGSYSTIRLISDSFVFVGDIAEATAKTLNIPPFLIKLLMTVLAISIIFAIIYLVFRFKG